MNHNKTPPTFILLFKGAHLNIADSVPYIIAIRGNPTSSPIDMVPIVVIPGANFTKNAIATDTITITATKRANTSGIAMIEPITIRNTLSIADRHPLPFALL